MTRFRLILGFAKVSGCEKDAPKHRFIRNQYAEKMEKKKHFHLFYLAEKYAKITVF